MPLNLLKAEVIVELLKLKCLPVLFYGLESCPINKSQTRSLDFAINSAFSKIFCMKSRGDIESCRMLFNCLPVADSLYKRKRTFLCKYISSSSVLCRLFASTTADECGKVQSV